MNMPPPLGFASPIVLGGSRTVHLGWITMDERRGRQLAITLCGIGTSCGSRKTTRETSCPACKGRTAADPGLIAPEEDQVA